MVTSLPLLPLPLQLQRDLRKRRVSAELNGSLVGNRLTAETLIRNVHVGLGSLAAGGRHHRSPRRSMALAVCVVVGQ